MIDEKRNETKFIKDDGVISKNEKKNIVYCGSNKKCLKSFSNGN